MKAERDYLKGEVSILRDSTRLQSVIINKQDSVMATDSSKISEYKTREGINNQIIGNKDKEIIIYKKRYNKLILITYTLAGITTVLVISTISLL